VKKPKGSPACAERAIDILLARDRRPELEAEAWSLVEELAVDLNRRLAVENGAPRIKQITERADKALSMTLELHDFMKSLDAATLFVVRTGGQDFGIFNDKLQFKQGPTVEEFINTLRAFASALDFKIGMFAHRFPQDIRCDVRRQS
jgi:hypothetical protein